MSIIRNLVFSPLFWLGVGLRFLFAMGFEPIAITDWYSPFLSETSAHIELDPWTQWLRSGGNVDAFPYGYIMWLVFLPITIAANFLSIEAAWAYKATIFMADLCLFGALLKLLPSRTSFVLKAYWLSPIIIVASYVLGLNDVIPAALLLVAVYFLRHNKIFISASILTCAISAKLSMLAALPFFVIYIYNNRSHRHHLPAFFAGVTLFGFVLGLPFLSSEAAVTMLFGNPEMGKIFYLAMPIGKDAVAYIVPLLYLSLLYMGWRVRPLNFELFSILIGVSFLAVVLLTPASPGWFIWTLPFLVLYQARGDKMGVALAAIFSISYLAHVLLVTQLYLVDYADNLISNINLPELMFGALALKLLQTGLLFAGGLIAIRMWREEITGSNFFRFNRKPITIGIAGDSGAGKDTLTDALEGLIGAHSVVKLSGDDYHRWDRLGPMWQVMTHINPMANDLQSFSNDLFDLRDGKSINQRHYDHTTGKMTKPLIVESNQFILASGLHTFSLPLVRNVCDLKIFLDIDEDLRRFFKIRRDVGERGHSLEKVLASLAARAPDSNRFIRPQSDHAEIVMSLKSLNNDILKDPSQSSTPRLKLSVTIRNSYNEVSLQRVLVGICGFHVDMVGNNDGSEITLTIEGESKAEDMAQAAIILSPMTLEYLDETPVWEDGMLGIMQIVIFSQISQLITKSVV